MKAERRRIDKHGEKVNVWAVIGPNFRRIVVFPRLEDHVGPGKRRRATWKLTKQRYWDLCVGPIAKHLKKSQLFFLQDNCSVHNEAKRVLEERGVHTFGVKSPKYPARSPDLNPIEEFWKVLQERVWFRDYNSHEELAAVIKEEFERFTNAELMAYVKRFMKKCDLVVAANGHEA